MRCILNLEHEASWPLLDFGHTAIEGFFLFRTDFICKILAAFLPDFDIVGWFIHNNTPRSYNNLFAHDFRVIVHLSEVDFDSDISKQCHLLSLYWLFDDNSWLINSYPAYQNWLWEVNKAILPADSYFAACLSPNENYFVFIILFRHILAAKRIISLCLFILLIVQ